MPMRSDRQYWYNHLSPPGPSVDHRPFAVLLSPHLSLAVCSKMITVFPSYTIAGFIAAVLVLIPLPRQTRAGNIATMAMTFWFFQHCLAASINTVVWRKNVINVAPTWCDISECCAWCLTMLLIFAWLVQLPHFGTVSS
jgi:Pheromone A receptor